MIAIPSCVRTFSESRRSSSVPARRIPAHDGADLRQDDIGETLLGRSRGRERGEKAFWVGDPATATSRGCRRRGSSEIRKAPGERSSLGKTEIETRRVTNSSCPQNSQHRLAEYDR